MRPDLSDLYAGFSGCNLVPERFELGGGAVISQTYAHFMAPLLMAFAPAPPGKPHPTPWRAASGGLAIDITAELYLPLALRLKHLDRLSTIWWIAALLRLKCTTALFVPVVSNERFSVIPHLDQDPELLPVEIQVSRLGLEWETHPRIGVPDLEWVKVHWEAASELLRNENFNFAMQAVDSCTWSHSPDLALVSIWGGLERLFSPSRQELSLRVSANLASFLDGPGRRRHVRFRGARELYNRRSRAAHGAGEQSGPALQETYEIARAALLKMIETRHVPSSDELEAALFGDEDGIGPGSPLQQ